VATHRIRSAIALSCAGLLLAGCGDAYEVGSVQQREPTAVPDAPGAGPDGVPAATANGQEDTATLVERALAAQADRPEDVSALISAASQACPDPDAARRLGEVSLIAERWSSALLEGRPMAQAVTEAQLATIDWDALVSACIAS
jgi:hypothetical protein